MVQQSCGYQILSPPLPSRHASLPVVTKCKLRGTDAQIRAAQNCIRILFDDSDQVYGGPVDHVLPPNPYANCIVIGGH